MTTPAGFPASVPPSSSPPPLDPARIQRFLEQARSEQNLPLAILAGGVSALVAAILWALVTVLTDYQIGWMAIGVGFVVGIAVRTFGRGIDRRFGVVGAGFSLVGCLVGNLFTIVAVVAREEAASVLDVLIFLLLNPAVAIEAMVVTFQPMDLLFYAIALYEGFRFAFRRFTPAELAAA